VTLSRALARQGWVCCRFDLSGLGDSPPSNDGRCFRDSAASDVRQVITDLRKDRSLQEFVLVGVCGGADVAFDVAGENPHVVGAVLVNGAFVDGEAFADAYHRAEKRTRRRLYRRRMLSVEGWARLLTLRSAFWKRLARSIRRRRHASAPANRRAAPATMMERSGQMWAALAKRNIPVLLVFSQGSVFWDMFRVETRREILGSCPPDRLQLVRQKATDHTFTLMSSQQRLTDTILSWLDGRIRSGQPDEEADVA